MENSMPKFFFAKTGVAKVYISENERHIQCSPFIKQLVITQNWRQH